MWSGGCRRVQAGYPVAVKRNIIANYIGQALTSLLGIAFIPIYIRYLTIEAYGVVGIFSIIQVWMSLLDFGMGPALAREMALFRSGESSAQPLRDLVRSLEIVFAGVAGLAATIIAVASPFIAAHWLNRQHLSPAAIATSVAIMAFVTGLRFVEGIYRCALIGMQHQVWLNGAAIVLAALRSVGAIAVLALVSPTVVAFFLWQGAVSLVSLGLLAARVNFSLPRTDRRGSCSRCSPCC